MGKRVTIPLWIREMRFWQYVISIAKSEFYSSEEYERLCTNPTWFCCHEASRACHEFLTEYFGHVTRRIGFELVHGTFLNIEHSWIEITYTRSRQSEVIILDPFFPAHTRPVMVHRKRREMGLFYNRDQSRSVKIVSKSTKLFRTHLVRAFECILAQNIDETKQVCKLFELKLKETM